MRTKAYMGLGNLSLGNLWSWEASGPSSKGIAIRLMCGAMVPWLAGTRLRQVHK